ncbi:MAG TPA: bifunctional phosphoribosylaminoimidazolecarboxamide formyltransferase/IMP cyclohydrolase [Nitrolancea sp.]|nr:bifunctional phosphoribosylaminoimidazolecarboxamide formyltransferase/IMP cyclohydrolase [Nitrolancea sp.]
MRALLSVWDKSGIVDFARRLHACGIELVSTGGTKSAIEQAGIPVTAVSDVTGFPEILDGRVKTLHPRIHGGLLARRDDPAHLSELSSHEITPIDLVVSNLYPFSQVVERPEATLSDALEHIDIGGPSMIRAAAKNFPAVVIVVEPGDYDALADQIEQSGLDSISQEQRRALAAKAFAHVSAYDAVIAAYLRDPDTFPAQITVAGEKLADLRYGENPHQRAALYRQLSPAGAHGVARWQILAGKAMSYINYLDADAAHNAANSFAPPAIAIVKHASPSGIATAPDLKTAYESALASDPISAFGGILASNHPIDIDVAERIVQHYFEVVVAPGYSDEALERLGRRKNLRLIVAPPEERHAERALRQLNGAFLLQDVDHGDQSTAEWTVATNRAPSESERAALEFAWTCVRHVSSNAIVLAVGSATVGIGGGQPNRVDAVRTAIERAGERAAGSVLASDAYFPFADNIEVAAAAGITAIVQPGGSVRDAEVIEAANNAGIAMLFTGTRHFRH